MTVITQATPSRELVVS